MKQRKLIQALFDFSLAVLFAWTLFQQPPPFNVGRAFFIPAWYVFVLFMCVMFFFFSIRHLKTYLGNGKHLYQMGKVVFGFLQFSMGLFLLWSSFHQPPPPFTVGKGFFIPAWYIVILGTSLFVTVNGIKNIRKGFIKIKA